MKFSFKEFFSKYDQIPTKLRIWSITEKSLMEIFIIFVQYMFTAMLRMDFNINIFKEVSSKLFPVTEEILNGKLHFLCSVVYFGNEIKKRFHLVSLSFLQNTTYSAKNPIEP